MLVSSAFCDYFPNKMKAYGISALLFLVVVAVSADSEQKLLKKLSDCAKATNWSKERLEESCKNPIPEDEAERKTFLTMNRCMWETAGVVDRTGKVNAENVRNLVKPEEATGSISLVKKCTPKDDKLNVDETARALYQCYRDSDTEKFIRDCVTLMNVIQ